MLKKNSMIAIDPNYQPVHSSQNDELYQHGIFEWNITRVIIYLEDNKANILQSVVEVDKEFSSGLLNESHVETVDLSKPIIQAEINPGVYVVIDGHHRIAKAKRNHVPRLNSYRLTVNQHIPFFTSLKSYQAFIEYWNSKITHTRL